MSTRQLIGPSWGHSLATVARRNDQTKRRCRTCCGARLFRDMSRITASCGGISLSVPSRGSLTRQVAKCWESAEEALYAVILLASNSGRKQVGADQINTSYGQLWRTPHSLFCCNGECLEESAWGVLLRWELTVTIAPLHLPLSRLNCRYLGSMQGRYRRQGTSLTWLPTLPKVGTLKISLMHFGSFKLYMTRWTRAKWHLQAWRDVSLTTVWFDHQTDNY